MIFLCLHISHGLSKAQRTEGLEFGSTGCVDVSLPFWAPSSSVTGQHHWAFQGLMNSYFGLCQHLMRHSHLAMSMGDGQASVTALPSSAEQGGSCAVHRQGAQAGLTRSPRAWRLALIFTQYLINQCAWRSMLMVSTEKFTLGRCCGFMLR